MQLDNLKQQKKLDKGKVGESISLLPDQIKQVVDEARLIKVPKTYCGFTQIVVNGMGGSNLGAGIIKAVFSQELSVPLSIVPGYSVPKSVDKDTLYIISSYSGSTEEPLSAYSQAKKQGAKIMAITSDNPKSKLARLMKKNNIPGYIFKPNFNPSNQPRLGLGYMIFGTIVMLNRAGFLKIKTEEIKKLAGRLETRNKQLSPTVLAKNNIAKKLAKDLYRKQPIIVGAEFLMGNLRAMRNQFCENSKNFASYLALPELNHYALESLANPKSNRKNLIFLFFDSKLYHPRVQLRSKLTQAVVKKNKIKFLNYQLKSKTKLEQSFEVLQLGIWLTFYLAMLNRVNPSKIPWVDWFKKQLG